MAPHPQFITSVVSSGLPAKRALTDHRKATGFRVRSSYGVDATRRNLQSRHRRALKQLAARGGEPAGPFVGAIAARAIRRESGARIHLPVELGNKDERQSCAQAVDAV